MSRTVTVAIHSNIATITLNRPDKLNALNAAMCLAFADAVEKVWCDGSARVVLLKGEGRAFCAGGDIGDFCASASLPELLDSLLATLNRAILRLASLPVPVISVVNGPIGGGGIGIALCADFVLASETMKLRGGYSLLGLTPDAGSSWFLTRRAGVAQAKRILMLNRPLTARDCLAVGVVDELHPPSELGDAANRLAQEIVALPAGSVSRIKQLTDRARWLQIGEHLELERKLMVVSGGSEDAREGVAAFVEKRSPQFNR